jgi:hypothetical protein
MVLGASERLPSFIYYAAPHSGPQNSALSARFETRQSRHLQNTPMMVVLSSLPVGSQIFKPPLVPHGILAFWSTVSLSTQQALGGEEPSSPVTPKSGVRPACTIAFTEPEPRRWNGEPSLESDSKHSEVFKLQTWPKKMSLSCSMAFAWNLSAMSCGDLTVDRDALSRVAAGLRFLACDFRDFPQVCGGEWSRGFGDLGKL